MDNLEIIEHDDLYETIVNNYRQLNINIEDILSPYINIKKEQFKKDELYNELINAIKREIFSKSRLISPAITIFRAIYGGNTADIPIRLLATLGVSGISSLISLRTQLKNSYQKISNSNEELLKEENKKLMIMNQVLNKLPRKSKLIIDEIIEKSESLIAIDNDIAKWILKFRLSDLDVLNILNLLNIEEMPNNILQEFNTLRIKKNSISESLDTLKLKVQSIIEEERNNAAIEIARSYCSMNNKNNKNVFKKQKFTITKKQHNTFSNTRLVFDPLKKYSVGMNLH